MPIITPPSRIHIPCAARVVFLAGSIEMGHAADWQQDLTEAVLAQDPSVVVANPRRVQWDSSWIQSDTNPMFREQVEWELDHIDRANLVVFYFDPSTKSPISLLELGKHLARPDCAQSTIVCCPDGFWRKGNVEVCCRRAGLPAPLQSLDELHHAVSSWVNS